MKKLISIFKFSGIYILLFGLLVLGNVAQAQTAGSLSNLVPAGFSFKKDLMLGDTDSDIVYLQKILNSNPNTVVTSSGVGSPGHESTYFGPLTQIAVIKFNTPMSSLYGPNGILAGTGIVEKTTRTKLNLLIGVNTTLDSVGFPANRLPVNSAPVIIPATLPITHVLPVVVVPATNLQPQMSTCQFVELLINIGAIVPAKANIARTVLGCGTSLSTPSVDIRANGQNSPITVAPGSTITLSWTSANTVSCSAGTFSLPLTGSQVISMSNLNQSFSLTCLSASGTNVSDSVRVNISGAINTPSAPVVNVWTDPAIINSTTSPILPAVYVSYASPQSTTSNVYIFTNKIVSAKVYYGITAGVTSIVDSTTVSTYAYSANSATTSNLLIIPLANLLPNTTYHFMSAVTDNSGQVVTTLDQTFTTLVSGAVPYPPVIGNVSTSTGLNSVLGTTTKKNLISSVGVEETAGNPISAQYGGLGYPDIAVDSLGQPHILAQVGLAFLNLTLATKDTSSAFNLYNKIGSSWSGVTPLVHEVGGPKRPEIEIDANNRAWVSGMTFVSPIATTTATSSEACLAAITEGLTTQGEVWGYFKSIDYCESNTGTHDGWSRPAGGCTARDGSMAFNNPNLVDRNCRDNNSDNPFDAQCECDVYSISPTEGVVSLSSLNEPAACKGVLTALYFDSATQFTDVALLVTGTKPSVVGSRIATKFDTSTKLPSSCEVFSGPNGPWGTEAKKVDISSIYTVLGGATEIGSDNVADAETLDNASSTDSSGDDDEIRIPFCGDWVGSVSNVSTSPTLSWFTLIRPWVNSFVGNVAIDPFYNTNAWHMGIQWPTPTNKFTTFGTYANDKTMSPGRSGEKIIFRIAPQKNLPGIWQAAMGGASKEDSSYINSTMSNNVVWANYNTYPRQGDDMSYVDLGIDWNNPKTAYIVGSYKGVVINIWDGTKMVFPNNSLYTVDSDPASYGNGAARWSPKWAPAMGGGAFLCWTGGDDQVKLKYISPLGVASFGPTTNISPGNQCNIATDYQGNIHLTYMNGGSVKYRKIMTSQ